MCSLYRLPETKNHNFGANFGLFGLMGQKNENLHKENLLPKKVSRLVGKFLEFMRKMCNLVTKILDSFANSGPFEACASPGSIPGSNVMRSTDTVRIAWRRTAPQTDVLSRCYLCRIHLVSPLEQRSSLSADGDRRLNALDRDRTNCRCALRIRRSTTTNVSNMPKLINKHVPIKRNKLIKARNKN